MSGKCKNPRKHHACKKHIWNLNTSTFDNGKYLARITGSSIVIYNKIIEVATAVLTNIISTKTIPTNFNEKGNLQNRKFLYFT